MIVVGDHRERVFAAAGDQRERFLAFFADVAARAVAGDQRERAVDVAGDQRERVLAVSAVAAALVSADKPWDPALSVVVAAALDSVEEQRASALAVSACG